MHTVTLQQVSSPYAQENAERTLDKPIGLKFVRRHLAEDEFARLESICTNGSVYVWGSKTERSHQTLKVIGREALFLFRRNQNVYKYGIVIHKTANEPLAESLWGRDIDGKTWSAVYFFARITDKRVPAARINEQLGRSPKDNWQGLVVLTMKESEKVNEFFRSHLEEL